MKETETLSLEEREAYTRVIEKRVVDRQVRQSVVVEHRTDRFAYLYENERS